MHYYYLSIAENICAYKQVKRGFAMEYTRDDLLGVVPIKGETKGSAFARIRQQRMIFDKFGAEGVSIYASINGKKSVEEIRAELNMQPQRIVEILEFMENEGIVQLKTIFELENERNI